MSFAEVDIKVLVEGSELCVIDKLNVAEEETLGDDEMKGVTETDSSKVCVEGFSVEVDGVNVIVVKSDGVAEDLVETEDDGLVL